MKLLTLKMSLFHLVTLNSIYKDDLDLTQLLSIASLYFQYCIIEYSNSLPVTKLITKTGFPTPEYMLPVSSQPERKFLSIFPSSHNQYGQRHHAFRHCEEERTVRFWNVLRARVFRFQRVQQNDYFLGVNDSQGDLSVFILIRQTLNNPSKVLILLIERNLWPGRQCACWADSLGRGTDSGHELLTGSGVLELDWLLSCNNHKTCLVSLRWYIIHCHTHWLEPYPKRICCHKNREHSRLENY